MTAKKSGASPDQRRKYDEAFKAEALRPASESRSTQAAARQLGIRPKLLYRWQPAQLVAEAGSVEVARAPEVRPAGRRLAVTGRVARPLLAQDCGLVRAQHDARKLGQRGPAPGRPAAGRPTTSPTPAPW